MKITDVIDKLVQIEFEYGNIDICKMDQGDDRFLLYPDIDIDIISIPSDPNIKPEDLNKDNTTNIVVVVDSYIFEEARKTPHLTVIEGEKGK